VEILHRKHEKRKMFFCISIVALFVLWTLIPIILLISQSVKPDNIMFADPPQYIFHPVGTHFTRVFIRNNILESMTNSVITSLSTMLLCVVLGSLCAYSLARVRIPGSKAIALFIVLTRTVPAGALMLPMYVLMRKLGIANTYLAVILAHTTLNLPFAVLMMKGFFQDVPLELEQAAQVDGCSRMHTFLKICIPLTAPGLATTGIMVLLNSWNEFMFALILTGRGTRTLPIAISSFLGSVSIDWGASSAAATLATVPIFIAGMFIQKYFVRGLTNGAVKG
jgi:ABC-type sugar transport system, permease component